MNDNENLIENLAYQAICDYINAYNYNMPKLSLLISDNIEESYFKLRPEHKNTANQKSTKSNGTLVPPASYDGTFTILINKEYMLNDINNGQRSWIGTIIHELTHARDYLEYANIKGIKDYDEILNIERHFLFQIWTEFNARRYGYLYVRKYSFENIRDIKQLQFINQEEIPYQINYMFDKVSNEKDMFGQIYPVVHFLGRLSVLKELFPDYFKKDIIIKLFKRCDWIYELFEFLDTHQDLNYAVSDFEKMREILKQNYKCIK